MCTSQIHWVWQVLIGFGAVAALAVNLYGGMTWGLVSLKKHGLSIDFRTVAGATSNCVVLLLAPFGFAEANFMPQNPKFDGDKNALESVRGTWKLWNLQGT